MNEMPAYPLRALSIGEIFDRAVTIYVKNFVLFTAIVLTVLAPYAVAQYALFSGQGGFEQIFTQAQHPNVPVPTLPPGALVGIVSLAFLAVLLAPFASNAVAVGVAEAYSGRASGYAAAYKRVLRRAFPLLLTLITSGLILLGTYMGLGIVVVIVAMIGVAFVKPFLPLAVLIFAIAVACFLALIVALIMLVMMSTFATYATVLENADVGQAIQSAFRRIFSRPEFTKAFLMALAYLAIEFGVMVLAGSLAFAVLMFMHNLGLQLVFSTILNAVLTAFITVLLAVYYFDVRTRTEGLDLEVDLGQLVSNP